MLNQLRTCSSEERRSIAIELGKMGSDDIVVELKRMVECKRRIFFRWYNLEDQLIGIEALGETKRKEVLEYLKKVYTPTTYEEKRSYRFLGDDGLPDIDNCVTWMT